MDSGDDDAIGQLLQDFTNLQAAHQSLIKRYEEHSSESYAEAQDELNTLRQEVKRLQDELTKTTEERDELSAAVRDLRVRVEESRRALMRLQGGGGSSSAAGGDKSSGMIASPSGSTLLGSLAAPASASVSIKRRSAGPSALASWNPKELSSSQSTNSQQTEQDYSRHTPEEAAELKKSKRASLAFGYNGQATLGRRAHGHRRIASGSRIDAADEDAASSHTVGPSPTSQGLRELHLGGSTPSGTSSKRSSMYGLPFGSHVLSPASSDLNDLPSAREDPGARPERLSSSSLLMPAKSIRRASNSSSFSGSQREDSDASFLVASNTSRGSISPIPSAMTSPILEADENNAAIWIQRRYEDETDEPYTARAFPTGTSLASSIGGTFSAMQAPNDYHRLQRMLSEQKSRVQDRDLRLEGMQKEMQAMRMELEEAKEARLASETCLKALRDFVKDEGGASQDADGGARMLKGVKLPPLPTDRDTDDLSSDSSLVPATPSRQGEKMESATPTQATSSTNWRAFSNTFAGLSRGKSHASEESTGARASYEASNGAGHGDDTAMQNSAAPLSPSVNFGNSIGTFWSRATTAKKDSTSVSSSNPSVGTSNGSDSPHTSMTSNSVDAPTLSPNLGSAPASKGLGWFSRKSAINEEAEEVSGKQNTTRVSTPPFANLDNHVLTLDAVQTAGNAAAATAAAAARRTSATSSSGTASKDEPLPPLPSKEPNDRVRKAMRKSEGVDGDTGFVPPAFEE